MLKDREKNTVLNKFYYYYNNRFSFVYDKQFIIAKIKGISERKRNLKNKNKNAFGFAELARYHMLAYAFLRKMPYKVVEQKCGKYNNPYPALLSKIVKQCISPTQVNYCHLELENLCDEAVKEWLNVES